MKVEDGTRRESDNITFDREGMHHTGYEVFSCGKWWYEFIDDEGEIHLLS